MNDNHTIQKKRRSAWLILIPIVVVLTGIAALPPVWSRIDYHSRELYRTIKYWISPPSEAVFVPSTHGETPVAADSTVTPANTAPSVTPTAPPTSQTAAEPTDQTTVLDPELTSTQIIEQTPTPAPLPPSVLLTGIRLEAQTMNNCGPATLSMNLSYYDWGKDQDAVDNILKPNIKDVNVMPYELVDYVNEHTEYKALWRYGGELQTIRALLNAGIPVMIEKGFYPFTLRNEGWLGHYNLVVGYDDEREILTVQDSYLTLHTPWGTEIAREQFESFIGFDFAYSELEQAWRSFNYVFIVVFPPQRENEVLNILGPLATTEGAYQVAYDRAMAESTSMLEDPRDRFFAWFNVGTNLVGKQDYPAAAAAFDHAFEIYPDIEVRSRPYRILWYEVSPYEAYYKAERYEDVIALANQTLQHMAEPVLEESYYWRGLSYLAVGNTTRGLADLRSSLQFHPGYAPSLAKLEELNETP